MNVPRGKIVPLNVDRKITFNNPKVFRTGNGKPWIHPGFPGLKISEAVMHEITNVLLPKYLPELFSDYE